MEDLLAYLARQLVDSPDEVRVERHEGQSGELVLELRVVAADLLERLAVARLARVGDDDPVDRVLLTSVT